MYLQYLYLSKVIPHSRLIVYKKTDEWQRMTTSGTTSDNEWQRVVQRVTTNDNEWQRVVQRVTTSGTKSDNEWQRVTMSGTTSDNEWQQVVQRVTMSENRLHRMTRSDNEWQFCPNSFFQIIWCWYEPFFLSLRQRLLQTVVTDVFKIYVNLSKRAIVIFLKLSTSYLLFLIKMRFFFFDEKQIFCFALQKDARLSLLACFVIKQKPLVKTVKTHGKFL